MKKTYTKQELHDFNWNHQRCNRFFKTSNYFVDEIYFAMKIAHSQIRKHLEVCLTEDMLFYEMTKLIVYLLTHSPYTKEWYDKGCRLIDIVPQEIAGPPTWDGTPKEDIMLSKEFRMLKYGHLCYVTHVCNQQLDEADKCILFTKEKKETALP